MPFFHELTAPPARAPEYLPPAWTGPSEFEVARAMSLRQIVVRNPDVVVILDVVRTYSNGLELSFEVICREPLRRRAFRSGAPFVIEDNPDGLRVGYASSDGRCAGEQPTDLATLPRDELGMPYISVLVPGLGRTGGHRFELLAWCWPLPPPGRMKVYLEWPDLGVSETSVEFELVAPDPGDGLIDAW